MAKRERDGWRVVVDKAGEFAIASNTAWIEVLAWKNGLVHINRSDRFPGLTPARAAQFAAKVAAIAAKAAKEAK